MTLQERDKKYLWHPLTQHKTKPNNLAITKAKDCTLWDENGKEYIDGIASWYTCMYGHCNAYIISKIKDQLGKLDQVVFSGMTHEPVIEMSEKLMTILPKNQEKIFFSDNGSTSVDISIKMALQYHFNKGENRKRILCFEEAFHGDTFGAMSVSGLSVYNGPFNDFCIEVERIPVPNNKNWEDILQLFKEKIKNKDVACFIYEPLVQGAAAMKIHKAEYLNRLIHEAQKMGTLCIADEVMTGFGKTGKNFASDYMENKADIICLSKSLTGGVVPMALTTCTQNVYDAFYDDELSKGLFHGHTYSANPLACTAVSASIDLLKSEEIQNKIIHINNSHKRFSDHISKHPKVENTRVLGVIFALDLNIELDRYGTKRDEIFDFFMENGVFLRPLGKTIYILAPFVITEEELNKIYTTIEKLLNEVI